MPTIYETAYTEAQRYPLQIFSSVKSKRPKNAVIFFRAELITVLATSRRAARKEDVSLFSGVDYLDASAECRKTAGISAVHMVVGDIDEAFEQGRFDAGISTLRSKGLAAVAYQTFNSKSDAERWRVVVLLDTPVHPLDYPRCWQGLNTMFGGILDGNAKDAARLSYLASHPEGQTRESIVLEART